MKLPFHRPSLDGRELEAVRKVLDSGWLTTGDRVREFEERFAAYVGARHAVAVNSCTAALHIALAAEGIGADDEVITTPYTFIATVETICYLGARPVLVDVDPVTRNIDAGRIEASISRRTRAIVPVHVAGLPCDMDEINAIAARHGIPVLDDAAHALPAAVGGRRIGTLARSTSFSFYATKNLTTGEGGMLTTDDADLAQRCRRLSLHGISKDGWQRYRSGGSWYYEVLDMGFKYNLTDIAAAIGLVQLDKLDEFDRRRQHLASYLSRRLGGRDDLAVPSSQPGKHHAWHLYIVDLDEERARVGRDEFIEGLAQRGIGTSVHFIPVHYHPHYAGVLGHPRGAFPNAERAFRRAISLPLYPAMTDDEARFLADAVDEVLDRGAGG